MVGHDVKTGLTWEEAGRMLGQTTTKKHLTFQEAGKALSDNGQTEVKAVFDPYLAVMQEYTQTQIVPERQGDFWERINYQGQKERDPNIGWKCHLDVSPQQVQAVSRWLKKQKFCHKYLSGGEVEDGKIFTVYFGSRTSCISSVKEISDTIGDFLNENRLVLRGNTREPNGEARLAPKIYGRFVAMDGEFAQYNGEHGIPIQNSSLDYAMLHSSNPDKRKLMEMALMKAKKRLTEKYGDYFGGSIPEYKGNGVYAT